jgi:hypothetical protein
MPLSYEIYGAGIGFLLVIVLLAQVKIKRKKHETR